MQGFLGISLGDKHTVIKERLQSLRVICARLEVVRKKDYEG